MNQFGRRRLSSWWMLSSLGMLAWILATAQLPAQNTQSSCIVTTRGGPDVLDVAFLMECSIAESVGAVHFDVQAVAGPSSRDRELEIVFILSPSSDGRVPIVHRQFIALKEGATSVRGMMPFVMNSATESAQQRLQFWNVAVYEEGREIEGSRALQANPGGQFVPIRLAPGEPAPYMLHQRGSQAGALLFVLDNGAKYDGELASRVGSPLVKDSASLNMLPILESPTFDLARNFMRVSNVRHVESLPEVWHYYLQFNAVIINDSILARLQAERPLVADALKQYVAAGGDLVLISSDDEGPSLIDRWLTQREGGHRPEDWNIDRNSGPSSDFLEAPVSATATESPVESAGKVVSDRRWATRTHARGRFICFADQETVTVSAPAASTSRPTPVGVAISSVHDQTWSLRNMIASVGKPPVWTFCGIILLFGLILGPGLLILTGWIGRRSLLILLVPLVSIGATLAIVAYEVFHEGFDTHARISSVVSIDERTGEGFVWSRQNFYSGWPPRDGLSIPKNIYCRPVGSSRLGRAGVPRTASSNQYTVVHQAEESQWLGVLPAREQKQFLIGHPAKPTMPIQVKRIDDKRASLRNLTDETLPFVVLRDGGSGYYFAENVLPKADLELSSVPFGDIAGGLSRMRSELAPSLPIELKSMGWGVAQEQSGFEVLDQDWLGSMAELSSVSSIRPYGFVTLIRNCDAVYVPLKANASESLHLVTGSALW